MAEIKPGTYSATLALLANKGLHYATVFDVGSAEGNFFVQHHVMGIFTDSVPVNIDASVVYEPPLRAVQEALGGHYFIAAAGESSGETVITTSLDPAWTSMRPPGDPYWQRVNNVNRAQVRVPAVTLDNIASQHDLKGPYLIKLDVQGAEVAVLHGARRVLNDTHVVVSEADIADFHSIDRTLTEAGFALFDVTTLNYAADGSLAWFYPVYLSQRLDHLRFRAFWDPRETEVMVKRQVDRRRAILDWYDKVLPHIRAVKNGQEKA